MHHAAQLHLLGHAFLVIEDERDRCFLLRIPRINRQVMFRHRLRKIIWQTARRVPIPARECIAVADRFVRRREQFARHGAKRQHIALIIEQIVNHLHGERLPACEKAQILRHRSRKVKSVVAGNIGIPPGKDIPVPHGRFRRREQRTGRHLLHVQRPRAHIIQMKRHPMRSVFRREDHRTSHQKHCRKQQRCCTHPLLHTIHAEPPFAVLIH